MSDKFDSFKERRKHQRLPLDNQKEGDLSLQIVDHGPAFFFDMSYRGAALSQPEEKKITQVGQSITLDIKSDRDQGQLKAKVVRFDEKSLAVHFKDVGATTQMIIDRLVTDRIVGMNMKMMKPENFGSQADFDYWFHGPKKTNLYFWTEGDSLSRVHLETGHISILFEEDHFIFENREGFQAGVLKLNNRQIALKALALIQEMNMEISHVREFHDLLKDHTDD